MAYIPFLTNQYYTGHYDEVTKFVSKTGNLPSKLNDINFVFICFSNRCGSNFLAECLASGGFGNLASEFLNSEIAIPELAAMSGSKDFHDYFSNTVIDQSRDGIFITKLAISHIFLLNATGILDEIIPRAHFIHVERSDKISQAISFSIAERTNRWASYEEGNGGLAEFDFDEIRDKAFSLIEQDWQFDEFFAGNGIRPLKVIYEQFSVNPLAAVEQISQFIGRPIPVNLSSVRTEQQATRQNIEWRNLFIEMIRAA
jgi:LPS sulfotransferase NodH